MVLSLLLLLMVLMMNAFLMKKSILKVCFLHTELYFGTDGSNDDSIHDQEANNTFGQMVKMINVHHQEGDEGNIPLALKVLMMNVFMTSRPVKGTIELMAVFTQEYAKAKVVFLRTARHVRGFTRPAVIRNGPLKCWR